MKPSILLILSVLALSSFAAGPQLKWLYVSTGTTLDRWESSSLKWEEKDEFPKTLRSLNIGAQFKVGASHSLFFSLPGFYNSTESFWSNEEQILKAPGGDSSLGYNYHKRPRLSTLGIGDAEAKYTYYATLARLELAVWAPTGYKPNRKVFYNPDSMRFNAGYFYNSPWMGFGVWRAGPGISTGNGTHYCWAQTSAVLYKPRGENPGLVEVGDFSLSGGYAYTAPLTNLWKLKPKTDLDYSSYHWEGAEKPGRVDFSVTPGLALSFTPTWQHEISLSLSATAYGHSVDKGKTVNASRQMNIGLYYGYYI